MVNKLWFRELVRKWFQTKFERPRPRCFSEPKVQEELKSWYLAYRWLIFGVWLGIIVCSVLEIGSVQKLGNMEKWPIYLTNWDLTLGLVQAFLGALIVSRRWRVQRSRADFDPNSHLDFGKLERVYWFLYVVTSSLALGVTVTYWAMVHDPKYHQVDFLNIMIHVTNSVLMLVDLCVAGIPFQLRCFWWCPLLTSFYIIFSVIYYQAGGLDKRGQHRIYSILDWKKPWRTLLVCAGGLTFLVITHCLLYFIARFRDRAYEKRRNQPQQDNAVNKGSKKNESMVWTWTVINFFFSRSDDRKSTRLMMLRSLGRLTPGNHRAIIADYCCNFVTLHFLEATKENSFSFFFFFSK